MLVLLVLWLLSILFSAVWFCLVGLVSIQASHTERTTTSYYPIPISTCLDNGFALTYHRWSITIINLLLYVLTHQPTNQPRLVEGNVLGSIGVGICHSGFPHHLPDCCRRVRESVIHMVKRLASIKRLTTERLTKDLITNVCFLFAIFALGV